MTLNAGTPETRTYLPAEVFWEGARPRAPKHPPCTLIFLRSAGTRTLP